MNIFLLSLCPIEAVQQCDKHVVKMPIESAQMMCTAGHGSYKPTHQNHPCTRWATLSEANFEWLTAHALALCDEYTYRYGRRHKSQDVIEAVKPPIEFPLVGLTLVSAAKSFRTFDDYIASLDYVVTSDQYDLMEATWNAAISALNEQNCALTRSDDATSMQNKTANLAEFRAQEELPDLKILRDHNDGYLYVWENVSTQWKMKARYRTWTDALNSLMEKQRRKLAMKICSTWFAASKSVEAHIAKCLSARSVQSSS